jgi:hypothetical protein
MNVTLPNGKVISGVPEGTTKEQVKAKAIAAGLAAPEDFGDATSAPLVATAQSKEESPAVAEVGIGDALGAGFERGVKQSLGGAANKVLDASSSITNQSVDDFAARMQSGEIPATQENIDKLDRMQQRAIQLSQTKKFRSEQEPIERAAYAPIQDAQPVASAIGNIGGQLELGKLVRYLEFLNTWQGLARAPLKAHYLVMFSQPSKASQARRAPSLAV